MKMSGSQKNGVVFWKSVTKVRDNILFLNKVLTFPSQLLLHWLQHMAKFRDKLGRLANVPQTKGVFRCV